VLSKNGNDFSVLVARSDGAGMDGGVTDDSSRFVVVCGCNDRAISSNATPAAMRMV
jgi:hypothetical protein